MSHWTMSVKTADKNGIAIERMFNEGIVSAATVSRH